MLFAFNSAIFKSNQPDLFVRKETLFNATMVCVFWFIPVWLVKWTRFPTHFNALLPEYVNVFSSICTIVVSKQDTCGEEGKLNNLIYNQSKQKIVPRVRCLCPCGNLTLEDRQLVWEFQQSSYKQQPEKGKPLDDCSPQRRK